MYVRTNPVQLLPHSILLLGAVLTGAAAWAQSTPDAGFIIKCPHMPTGLSEVPTCRGERVTCVGSDGHDLIWGSEMRNVIYAGAGNDAIKGSEENDVICGGPGNDSIHGARGDDALYGDEGSDMLFAGPGTDVLEGGPGDFDMLWGGPDFDQLDGGDGAFDYCLIMRDDGQASVETCEIIFPPIGFDHEAGQEIPSGLLAPTAPRDGARRTSPKAGGQVTHAEAGQEYKSLFIALTSPEANSQVLALTMAKHADGAGKVVRVLLCGGAVELALREELRPADMDGSEQQRLFEELLEKRIAVDVCPEYLSSHGLETNTLIDGVTPTDWPQTIRVLMGPHGKFMAF